MILHGAVPVLGVKRAPGIQPRGFVLSQNYPNPFNPSTVVQFSTGHAARIRLIVCDLLGRQVSHLVDENYLPGEYSARWDGRNDDGDQMPSGIYYLRMTASQSGADGNEPASYTSTRKMIMLK